MKRQNEVELKAARVRLSQLENALKNIPAGQCVYVAGFTYSEHSKLYELKDQKVLEIVHVSIMNISGWKKWLPVPRPNYFLAKLEDHGSILRVFDALLDYLKLELIVFNSFFEENFLNEAKSTQSIANWRSLEGDHSFFSYMIDTDCTWSSTGFSDIVEFRSGTPVQLKHLSWIT